MNDRPNLEGLDTYALAPSFTSTADARMVSIVCAYVSNNSVPPGELANLIRSVRDALIGPDPAASPAVERRSASEIKKSITPDALISFEDGKPYKTLRRHLTMRGLTMEAYRAKYGLPNDYPSVSASYSAQRSALAKSLGLGQQRRKSKPDKPKGKSKAETSA